MRSKALSFFRQIVNHPIDHTGADAVNQNWPGDGEHFDSQACDPSLCLCQDKDTRKFCPIFLVFCSLRFLKKAVFSQVCCDNKDLSSCRCTYSKVIGFPFKRNSIAFSKRCNALRQEIVFKSIHIAQLDFKSSVSKNANLIYEPGDYFRAIFRQSQNIPHALRSIASCVILFVPSLQFFPQLFYLNPQSFTLRLI